MLKFAPGAMEPELHTFASDVDVCAMLSLLTHVTVPPRGTVTGFGLYALVVSVRDPDTIETDAADEVGDGLLGVELPPQLTAANAAAKTRLGANTDQRIQLPPEKGTANQLPSRWAAFSTVRGVSCDTAGLRTISGDYADGNSAAARRGRSTRRAAFPSDKRPIRKPRGSRIPSST
jgi:hypothetical protein